MKSYIYTYIFLPNTVLNKRVYPYKLSFPLTLRDLYEFGAIGFHRTCREVDLFILKLTSTWNSEKLTYMTSGKIKNLEN